MWNNMRFRSDRENAGVVAASFVCTIAAVGVAGAVLLASRNVQGLYLSGGVLASGFGLALLVLLFGRRMASVDQSFWAFFQHRTNEEPLEYVPKKRRSKLNDLQSQGPPTVEQLHELKQNVNTWVPSGRPVKRK